ncbi:MAG: aminotransferase class V-fold PLP-dependent enzyme [Bacteriovoracaceae bacterium]|nr:aminotransferase class V-fold PLP-dependent enzyme [Bacteriovoracaceae bacterium]
MIYLDHAASSPLRTETIDEMQQSLQYDFANPSAIHKLGKYQQASLLKIKIEFLKSLSDDRSVLNDSFIFTSSATESNTTLIQGLQLVAGDVALYSEGDHPSLVQNIKTLINKGVSIKAAPLNKQGLVDLIWLEENMSKNVKLCTLSHVNNHNGSIQNLEEISKIIKNNNVDCHFHVDAVQSYGWLDIEVTTWNIDSVTISGHKISAPKGIAGLYIKKDLKVQPLLIGGGHQDGLRSSSEATSLVKSFNVARAEAFKDDLAKYIEMNIHLRRRLKKECPRTVFPFDLDYTSPKILTFYVKDISSDILLRHLEENEIYISSSSACSSKLKGASPVFLALNIEEENHKSILRLSLGWTNTIDELNKFCDLFNEIILDLEFLLKK